MSILPETDESTGSLQTRGRVGGAVETKPPTQGSSRHYWTWYQRHRNCNCCHTEGETTPAVSWCSICDASLCSNCHKAHRQSPLSRHHDVSEMTDEVKVKRTTKVAYSEHKEEFVKFLCRDCKKTLCQTCCILHHRKCESVVTLESMLPEMRKCLDARKEILINKARVEGEQVETLKSRSRELDETKSSVQFQIRSTAQRVIDAVKKQEKELLDKLTEVTDKQMDQLKADIKTADMARDIYRQQSELIDQALSSEGEMDVYDLYQSSESESVESVGDVKKRGTRIRIEFSQDVDSLDRALNDLSLGKIHEEVAPDILSTPVLSLTVHCRTKEDEKRPSLFDIVETADTLIVADFSNKCIKTFYCRNNQHHHSRLSMKCSPERIAKLGDNEVAVSLDDSKQIALVSVFPDLILDSTIKTQKEYIGLTALTTTTLAAGSNSPPCVDILEMSGNLMRSISPVHNEEMILKTPYFLCTTGQGEILISDPTTRSVVCVTPWVEVVFIYSPTGERALGAPAGIVSTTTGHILVVDQVGHKVTVLRESGEFVKVLLTSQAGINSPYGIDWDETRRMYVTHFSLHDGDTVQVFAAK